MIKINTNSRSTYVGENRCSSEGFFRDPNDCVKFYRCTRDEGADFFRVYEFACGPGTVFDPTISVCNHPGSSPPCENNGQQQLPEYNAANQPQQPEQYSSQPQQQVPSTSSDSYPNQQTSPNNYYEQPSIIAAPYPQSQPSEQQQSPNNAGYPSSQQPGSTYNQQPNNYNPDEWSSAYGQPYSSDQSPTNQYPDHRDYLPEQFGDPPSQQEQQQPESSQEQQQQPESPAPQQQLPDQPEDDVEQQLTNMDEDEITPEDEDCNCKPVSSVFQCKQEGRFADRKNCKNFYRCTNDGGGFIADQFECDMGSAFDEDTGKCVPESQSKCKSGLLNL